jgi:hypothetical protein
VQQEVQRQKILNSFQILDLKPTSSWKKIKQAYKTQAKKWHPDRNSLEEAKTRTAQINESYDFLSTFFDTSGSLNDPSGFFRSLDTGKDHAIKTNHRGEVKKRLIRFYGNKLASDDRRRDRRIETILIHLNFWFCVVNVLILPPALSIIFGWNGLLLALTANLIFILFTMSAVRNIHKIRIFNLKMRNT